MARTSRFAAQTIEPAARFPGAKLRFLISIRSRFGLSSGTKSRELSMRVFLAIAIVAALAAPAFAQDNHVPKYGEEEKEKTASQKAADKAASDASKRSLGAIPDQGPTDPWGTVRSDTPKATVSKAAKTTKAKIETKTEAKTEAKSAAKTGSAEARPQ
jgi:hypothetical protein